MILILVPPLPATPLSSLSSPPLAAPRRSVSRVVRCLSPLCRRRTAPRRASLVRGSEIEWGLRAHRIATRRAATRSGHLLAALRSGPPLLQLVAATRTDRTCMGAGRPPGAAPTCLPTLSPLGHVFLSASHGRSVKSPPPPRPPVVMGRQQQGRNSVSLFILSCFVDTSLTAFSIFVGPVVIYQ